MIIEKTKTVYFRGNPTTKQWFKGTVLNLYHPPTGQQFDAIGGEHAWFADTHVFIKVDEMSTERAPFIVAREPGYYVPVCLIATRLSTDVPDLNKKGRRG